MAIFSLADHANRDTIAITQWLAMKAAEGLVRGSATVYVTSDGVEHVVLSGRYKTRPEYTVNAGAKMVSHGLHAQIPQEIQA